MNLHHRALDSAVTLQNEFLPFSPSKTDTLKKGGKKPDEKHEHEKKTFGLKKSC